MTETPAPPEITEEDRAAARPFGAFLQEQRRGLLHSELTDELQALVAAVAEHGKKGELVLKVTVTPSKGGAHVTVSDEVKVKTPEGVRPESIFFIDAANNLVTKDPRQQTFELREAPTPTEIREAK